MFLMFVILKVLCVLLFFKENWDSSSFSRFILKKLIILWITVSFVFKHLANVAKSCYHLILLLFLLSKKISNCQLLVFFYWSIKYRNSNTFGLNLVLHLRDCFAHSEIRYLVWYSGYMNPYVHSKTTELYW